jgi:uncharacterized membrane protein YtjA (UPF0391 family)
MAMEDPVGELRLAALRRRFLLVALIAAAVGFSAIADVAMAGTCTGAIFIVLFALSLIASLIRPTRM